MWTYHVQNDLFVLEGLLAHGSIDVRLDERPSITAGCPWLNKQLPAGHQPTDTKNHLQTGRTGKEWQFMNADLSMACNRDAQMR